MNTCQTFIRVIQKCYDISKSLIFFLLNPIRGIAFFPPAWEVVNSFIMGRQIILCLDFIRELSIVQAYKEDKINYLLRD